MPFQKGQSGNPFGYKTKKQWLLEKERIKEARETWAKLLRIRDEMVLERRTEIRDGEEVVIEVVPSHKDLIACCKEILNRAVGLPHQAIEVESHGPAHIDRQAILAIIATPDAHAHAEGITAALTNRLAQIPPQLPAKDIPVTVSAPCQLPPPPPTPEEKTEHPQVTFHNFSSGNGKRREWEK
jgi:hypothetical protein